MAKASISPGSPPSQITSAQCLPGANGFSVTGTWTYSPDGRQMQVFNGGVWQNDTIYADGRLLATYRGSALTYSMTDWLGTKRAQIGSDGNTASYAAFGSYPFGNGYSETGSSPDANDLHFTGKESDFDTGNDYFGARFYNPNMGRFLSPDWASGAEAVPYADFTNPQSLNLYGYVGNNPLSSIDADGHEDCDDGSTQCFLEQHAPKVAAALQDAENSWSGTVGTLSRVADKLSQKTAASARESLSGMDLSPKGLGNDLNAILGVVVPAIFSDGLSLEAEMAEGLEIEAADGTLVKGYTTHGVDRAIGEGAPNTPGVRAGTSPQAILDALKNPKSIKAGIDEYGRPFKTFRGQDAKVTVNPATGKIVSVNPLSGAGAR